jgi:plastocyanin
LVLVLIVGVLIIALSHHHQEPTHSSPKATTAKSEPVAVQITPSGFQPTVVTVSRGATVTWTNTDTAMHQVAADPYPKDDSINGFDSTIQLNQADTLSFTFNKPGTYTYHDEKNPLKFKGTIVVK